MVARTEILLPVHLRVLLRHYVALAGVLLIDLPSSYPAGVALLAWLATVWVANVYMGLFARLRLDIKRERVEITQEEHVAARLADDDDNGVVAKRARRPTPDPRQSSQRGLGARRRIIRPHGGAAVTRPLRLSVPAILLALAVSSAARSPRFELVQPELFAASGAQPNAWADYDGDGDLDLFVGFRQDEANRLYRNDDGTFVERGGRARCRRPHRHARGVLGRFRRGRRSGSVRWLHPAVRRPRRLYRNNGAGKPFSDVASASGIDVVGEIRQPSFVDYDGDDDLDLFVAVRDAPNLLFRNDGGRFASVGQEMGIADPRRTVGAAWFDMDADGDLDVFVANQNGDLNGLFRNDRTRFVDVAGARSSWTRPVAPRPPAATVRASRTTTTMATLDLFVASYGSNFLYRNDGAGKFTEIAAQMNVAGGALATPSRWGDFDNDGWIDLYVSSTSTSR